MLCAASALGYYGYDNYDNYDFTLSFNSSLGHPDWLHPFRSIFGFRLHETDLQKDPGKTHAMVAI